MKYLVEPTGPFTLHDMFGMQQVQAYRPSVVTPTPFIENLRGTKLRVLEILTDEASDEPLADALDEDALKKAIAALPRPTKKSSDTEVPDDPQPAPKKVPAKKSG